MFDDQIRIFALAADALTPEMVATLLATYGAEAHDGRDMFRTLCCGWDDEAHTRLRALSFGDTFAPVPLVDGRVAVVGLWSQALLAAHATGELPLTAEELSDAQFAELRPEDAP